MAPLPVASAAPPRGPDLAPIQFDHGDGEFDAVVGVAAAFEQLSGGAATRRGGRASFFAAAGWRSATTEFCFNTSGAARRISAAECGESVLAPTAW